MGLKSVELFLVGGGGRLLGRTPPLTTICITSVRTPKPPLNHSTVCPDSTVPDVQHSRECNVPFASSSA